MSINSFTEIKCLILQADTMRVYLHRGFHNNKDVMFLQMENGQVKKKTISADFTGRIQVSQDPLMDLPGSCLSWGRKTLTGIIANGCIPSQRHSSSRLAPPHRSSLETHKSKCDYQSWGWEWGISSRHVMIGRPMKVYFTVFVSCSFFLFS